MYGYEHDIRGSQKRRASEKEQWLVLDGTCQVRTSRTASPRAMGIFGPLIMEKEMHTPVFQKLALLLIPTLRIQTIYEYFTCLSLAGVLSSLV